MKHNEHHPFGPSQLFRRVLCPGSFKLEQAMRTVSAEQNPAAAEGTLIHDAVARRDIVGLTEEQADLVKACLSERRRICVDDLKWREEVQLSINLRGIKPPKNS